MRTRKGQSSSGSAILLIILTVLIILYILFLPPQDRAELLGTSTGTYTDLDDVNLPGGQYEAFTQSVGRIEHISDKEQEHTIPSFRISTKTSGTSLNSWDSIYVKTSSFDEHIEDLSFKTEEELTKNVKISFTVGDQANGKLIVLLNGYRLLYDDLEPGTSHFVPLPDDLLERYNNIKIGVSSTGWAFWRVNDYQLRNVMVTGDVKDVSGARSKQVFFLDNEEYQHTNRALLKFYADCELDNEDRITIHINGNNIYDAVADCAVLTKIELDKQIINEGENEIIFITGRGDFLVTNIILKTILEEPTYPIWYYNLDKDYFIDKTDTNEICGEVDGQCPTGCEPDDDKDCC
ncbi:hypothetical protein GOV10_03080, partial [Candidatus Woesearchaeota archaeon]|nr:hypothetical protein [Candidatus Woesearchaeota archaeon]